MGTLQQIRYEHLVGQGRSLLELFDVGQLKQIGFIAASLPPRDFSLLYPFSFADLHLFDYPELALRFTSLKEIEQCRVLDVALELVGENEGKAMVAVSYQNGTTLLLALAKQSNTLVELSIKYLDSPLLEAMVDSALEPELYQLLQQSRLALGCGKRESLELGLFEVACSEEFFIEKVFSFPLTAEFALDWGPDKDCFKRLKPTYIREATAYSLRQSR